MEEHTRFQVINHQENITHGHDIVDDDLSILNEEKIVHTYNLFKQVSNILNNLCLNDVPLNKSKNLNIRGQHNSRQATDVTNNHDRGRSLDPRRLTQCIKMQNKRQGKRQGRRLTQCKQIRTAVRRGIDRGFQKIRRSISKTGTVLGAQSLNSRRTRGGA